MAINYATWNTGLVVDVSRYQRQIRADTLRAAGVRMVIGKLGQAFAMDTKFQPHRAECNQMDMPLSAYYWPDPIQNARPQAEWLLRQVDANPDVLAVCGDYEQWWAAWGPWLEAIQRKIAWAAVKALDPNRISDVYEEFSEIFAARCEKPLIAYTSKGFVISHAPGMAKWLNRYPLWNAAYIWGGGRVVVSWDELKRDWIPKAGATPLVPPGAGRIVGWQYTGDKLMLPGMYADDAGLERSPADVSIFDPAWLDLLITGKPAPIPEPSPAPAPLPLRATVIGSPYINIRSGPGIGYADIGDLAAGETINVAAVAGNDVWIEIAPGKWACARTGGRELIRLERVQE